jgi:hypothetical protein
MALLTVSLLNDGMMPSPILISNSRTTQQPNHPIAIMSRAAATQLHETIKDGYVVSISGQQRLSWFIGFVGENAICVVVEDGTGEEVKQIAAQIK